ncbi:hypothetical protein [Nonomuraea dietziae]|uniref:hypothetical protein n=1 Tax=Nonomuraea dietziae TaxID=65515 RepID=UPI003415E5F9
MDSVQLTVYLQRKTKHGDYTMPAGMKRSIQTKDTPTRKMTGTATYLQCYPVDDEVVWQTFATAKVTWHGQTKWQNDQALTAGAIVCPG